MCEPDGDGQRDRQRQQCKSGLAIHRVSPSKTDLEATRYKLALRRDCWCKHKSSGCQKQRDRVDAATLGTRPGEPRAMVHTGLVAVKMQSFAVVATFIKVAHYQSCTSTCRFLAQVAVV